MYLKTRPTVKVGQYKLRRGPVHQGVKDSRKDRQTDIHEVSEVDVFKESTLRNSPFWCGETHKVNREFLSCVIWVKSYSLLERDVLSMYVCSMYSCMHIVNMLTLVC